eukprot:GHRQ01016244.1.p4 GENE.GHRQ01016244.1~~GHRQ01016244.1.p4  ORF type:complete len:100 (+),score=0.18 GHRQ01016244.1:629-928(+)
MVTKHDAWCSSAERSTLLQSRVQGCEVGDMYSMTDTHKFGVHAFGPCVEASGMRLMNSPIPEHKTVLYHAVMLRCAPLYHLLNSATAPRHVHKQPAEQC